MGVVGTITLFYWIYVIFSILIGYTNKYVTFFSLFDGFN